MIQNYHSLHLWMFQFLPPELILKVFSFLSCENIDIVSFVCQKFRRIALDDQLWRQKFFELVNHNISSLIQNNLECTKSNSYRELINQWKLLPAIITTETLSLENIYYEARHGSITRTSIPIKIIHQPFIVLESQFNEENKEKKKEQIIPLLCSLCETPFPNPSHNLSFKLVQTSVIYYEVFLIRKNETNKYNRPFNPLFPYLEEAIGIGLNLDSNIPSRRHFPGWQSDTIGYHSDDGKIFLSVSFTLFLLKMKLNFFFIKG